MTARHSLDQIVRGLDGVTAGPWKNGIGYSDTCDFEVTGDETVIAGEYGIAEEADAAHIARCSPDAIREIAAYVRDLEERLAKAAEALEPFAEFADGTVDEIGWTDARPRERISTWFGPSDFRRARTALTTIRRTEK